MIDVTLICRECEHNLGKSPKATFAIEFEPLLDYKIQDTQAYMDKQFVARCGTCEQCDWEVVDVKEVDYARP